MKGVTQLDKPHVSKEALVSAASIVLYVYIIYLDMNIYI